jgi:hypothetical protein
MDENAAVALPAELVRDGADEPAVGAGREFPIPLGKFIASLAKTPEEVWGHLLSLHHQGENHTVTEWRELLAGHQQRKG